MQPATRHQTIDGFGTCLGGAAPQEEWYQELYLDDLSASIVRFDLTLPFESPYSDNTYNSPWFHNDPPLPGPDGNNVRTYTGPEDYSAEWNGRSAPIAVMTPDIDQNTQFFNYDHNRPKGAGELFQAALAKKSQLGDVKLIASIWSPAPWVKVSSGNTYGSSSGVFPKEGTPWPFIWYNSFAGGKLDVSGTPLSVFFDGVENTSSLVQFARGTAAYIRGFQNTYNVKLHALSIQNELNFEVFYNSAYYPLSSQYITAVKAIRTEFDKYADLKDIRLMGPEDLLGHDPYALWQYGSGDSTVHKNLQYIANIEADAEASAAIDFYAVHGYNKDGISSSGAEPTNWVRWVNGWETSPAPGIPANVYGTAHYGKKTWMTETSGEDHAWLAPASGFPNQGAFSIALKIHQALVYGQVSAWLYWQLAPSEDDPAGGEELTDMTQGNASPKYNAAKHFFKYIRPGAVRADVVLDQVTDVDASAYVHDGDATVTLVLINTSNAAKSLPVNVPSYLGAATTVQAFVSSEDALWQQSDLPISDGQVNLELPSYGVATLVARAN